MDSVVEFVQQIEHFMSVTDQEIDDTFKQEKKQLDLDLDEIMGYHQTQQILP